MKTWIALLRGINVGGNNILPMQDLRALLSNLGYTDARTYIQSGNRVFKSTKTNAEQIAGQITDGIENTFGFQIRVFVLTIDALDNAIADNPYPQGHADPKTVHLYFLSEPALNADVSAMQAQCANAEAFTLSDRIIYLFAPDGMGKSKLAAKMERLARAQATARNLRSAIKIPELTRSI